VLDFQDNPTDTVYGNLKLISQKKSESNEYVIEVKRADSSFNFQLRFINESKQLGKAPIQYEYNSSDVVILNLQPF
jgi:hypothetical protein